MKNIGLKSFLNQFSIKQAKCWDIAMAIALGNFKEESYLNFLFAMATMMRYRTEISPDFIVENIEEIIKMTFKEYEGVIHDCGAKLNIIYCAKKDLDKKVIERLKQFNLCILPVSYGAIFYSDSYAKAHNRRAKSVHFMVATEFDETRYRVHIKDAITMFGAELSRYLNNSGYLDIRLPQQYLKDMICSNGNKAPGCFFSLEEREKRLTERELLFKYWPHIQWFSEIISELDIQVLEKQDQCEYLLQKINSWEIIETFLQRVFGNSEHITILREYRNCQLKVFTLLKLLRENENYRNLLLQHLNKIDEQETKIKELVKVIR